MHTRSQVTEAQVCAKWAACSHLMEDHHHLQACHPAALDNNNVLDHHHHHHQHSTSNNREHTHPLSHQLLQQHTGEPPSPPSRLARAPPQLCTAAEMDVSCLQVDMFSRQEMTKMEQMSPSHVIPHLSTAIRCSEYPAMVSDDHDASLTYESSTCGHAAEARQEHPAALMEVDVAFVDEIFEEFFEDDLPMDDLPNQPCQPADTPYRTPTHYSTASTSTPTSSTTPTLSAGYNNGPISSTPTFTLLTSPPTSAPDTNPTLTKSKLPVGTGVQGIAGHRLTTPTATQPQRMLMSPVSPCAPSPSTLLTHIPAYSSSAGNSKVETAVSGHGSQHPLSIFDDSESQVDKESDWDALVNPEHTAITVQQKVGRGGSEWRPVSWRELSSLFIFTERVAADKLGMTLKQFKTELGMESSQNVKVVLKWPSRQVKSLVKLLLYQADKRERGSIKDFLTDQEFGQAWAAMFRTKRAWPTEGLLKKMRRLQKNMRNRVSQSELSEADLMAGVKCMERMWAEVQGQGMCTAC